MDNDKIVFYVNNKRMDLIGCNNCLFRLYILVDREVKGLVPLFWCKESPRANVGLGHIGGRVGKEQMTADRISCDDSCQR